MSTVLSAKNITVIRAQCPDGTPLYAVDDVSFDIEAGATLGIAGESGSGKTTLVHALLGHTRRGMTAGRGTIRIDDVTLPLTSSTAFALLRGPVIALMPQQANSVLDPIVTVGAQLAEAQRAIVGRQAGTAPPHDIADTLHELGFDDPEVILRRYPHQISGGQRQRIALCMALVGDPAVVILDEATTDFDVITQETVLSVIRDIQRARGFALIAVSHDLRVLRDMCRRLLIMYGGRVVESGPTTELLSEPKHPYTARLVERFHLGPLGKRQSSQFAELTLDAQTRDGCAYHNACELVRAKCAEDPPFVPVRPAHVTRCWFPAEVRYQRTAPGGDALANARRSDLPARQQPLLDVRGLYASHRHGLFGGAHTVVLRNVTLDLLEGEVVAVVGESGSGKTTLARVLIGLHRPDRGTVTFDGQPLAGKPAAARPLALRRDVQIIFQNPGNSLNPQSTVADILRHRIRTFEGISGEAARKRMAELLDWVRLRRDALGSRPGGLSGGEQQRVAIARALVGSPRLLICDEILSSLDVLMQARILELLREIQGSRRFSLLFISHDMSLVGAIARRIAVFRRGVACEFGYAGDVINRPQHDYTRELVHAAYLLDKTPQTTTDAQGEVRIR